VWNLLSGLGRVECRTLLKFSANLAVAIFKCSDLKGGFWRLLVLAQGSAMAMVPLQPALSMAAATGLGPRAAAAATAAYFFRGVASLNARLRPVGTLWLNCCCPRGSSSRSCTLRSCWDALTQLQHLGVCFFRFPSPGTHGGGGHPRTRDIWGVARSGPRYAQNADSCNSVSVESGPCSLQLLWWYWIGKKG
jgi:hypothetical protein